MGRVFLEECTRPPKQRPNSLSIACLSSPYQEPMQSEKNSVNEYNKTVQKSLNFSITKILREINFGILNVSNLPFLQF